MSKSTNKISAKAKFKCTIIAKISIIINIDTKNGLYGFCALNRKKKKKKFIFISKISKRERKTSITYIHTSCGNSHFSLARSQSICQKQNTNPLFKKRYTRKFSNNLSISCLESLEISGPKKPKFRFFFLTSFLFATISWEPNTPKKRKKGKKVEAKIVR